MSGWQIVPVVDVIPAVNVDIASPAVVNTDDVNAFEIAGRASAGTVRPIILRKRWLGPTTFQWQPCFIDIFDPFANLSAAGFFWLTIPLQNNALKSEAFAILNPDDVVFSGNVVLRTVNVSSILPTGNPLITGDNAVNSLAALNNISDTLDIIRLGIPDALGNQSSANALNVTRSGSTWLSAVTTNVAGSTIWGTGGTLQRIQVCKPGVTSTLTMTDGGASIGGTWDTTVARPIEIGARLYQNLVITTTGGTPAHLLFIVN